LFGACCRKNFLPFLCLICLCFQRILFLSCYTFKRFYVKFFFRKSFQQIKDCKSCHSASQRMACNNNLCIWILFRKFRSFINDFLCNIHICTVKSFMNFTSRTSRIVYVIKIKVIDPIIQIRSSSEGQDDFLVSSVISAITLRLVRRIEIDMYISHNKIRTIWTTWPRCEGSIYTIWSLIISQVLFCKFRIIWYFAMNW